MEHAEPLVECWVARPFVDCEDVAKYAVVFQARRNKLGLEEGEEDNMAPLPYNAVHEILEELQEKFHARPDQVRKRAADENTWNGCLTKKGSGLQSPARRAKGRFGALIHQTFGLQVENPQVNVGAQSPDVTIKKIDAIARIHSVYDMESPRENSFRLCGGVRKPDRRAHADVEHALGAPERRRLLWRHGCRPAPPCEARVLERRHEGGAIAQPQRRGGSEP